MGLDVGFVGSRVAVETFRPCPRNDFNEVMVALFVFCKKNEVAARVVFVDMCQQRFIGHVDLASQYGFEDFPLKFICFPVFFLRQGDVSGRFSLFGGCFCLFDRPLGFGVLFRYVIEKLLYPEHVSVVGDCKSRHSIGHGLVNKGVDRSLAVENRILGMDVEMDEFAHFRSVAHKKTEIQSYGIFSDCPCRIPLCGKLFSQSLTISGRSCRWCRPTGGATRINMMK